MSEEKSAFNLVNFSNFTHQKKTFSHSPASSYNDCSSKTPSVKEQTVPVIKHLDSDSESTIIMSDCEIIEILDTDDVEIVSVTENYNPTTPQETITPTKMIQHPIIIDHSQNTLYNSHFINRTKKPDAVLEKEKQMRFLREKYPSMESMTIHDILSRHEFRIEDAIVDIDAKLKNNDERRNIGNYNEWRQAVQRIEVKKLQVQVLAAVPPLAPIQTPQSHPATVEIPQSYPAPVETTKSYHAKQSTASVPVNEAVRKRNNIGEFSMATVKKAKRMRTEVVSDESDEGGDFRDNRVFNSDEDSDVEISNELTRAQKKVLDFFQNATANELLLMQTCSKKKVDALIECRPFKSWTELIEKLQENKHLSTDLLNFANQVLCTRTNISTLMKKCKSMAHQIEKAVAAGAGIKHQPALLNPQMRLTNYQMIGLNWLAVLHQQGVNGILADEMGLGKTIQVIAFFAHLKEIGATKGIPHLIAVPASTLDNWRIEFETWCPDLKVFMYYGTMEERKMYRIEYFHKGLISKYDVVLTTYSMLTNTSEERKLFRVTQMHYLVFDEAHMLKNMNTQRYDNLIRIKAANRILLTGTPLQNNLLELMSLLIFVMPTIFASKADDIKNLFQKNSKAAKQTAQEDLPKFEKKQICHAKEIMKPFLLRRLKNDVLQDLPKKNDELVVVPMAESQLDQYKNLVFHFQNNAKNPSTEEGKYSAMTIMSDLRKLSNHPLLLKYFYQNEDIIEMAKILAVDPFYKESVFRYIENDLLCMSDFEIHTLCKQYSSIARYELPDNLILNSGKFAYLDVKLEELKEGSHRVLIFSQYVIMLNVLEAYLQLRNHTYLRLDGSTPVIIRQELINQFTQDPNIFIFLLSTKAGGLGINLTAADTVIIHDIDFNPYNDKQAEDRCHRMGQTKPVSVVRLISQNSIEEGMWKMNQEKLKLEREVTANESETTDVKSVVRLLSTVLGTENSSISNGALSNGTLSNCISKPIKCQDL